MKMKMFHLLKTVATAGTREQLTTAQKLVDAVSFKAEASNTGLVYIGNDQVSASNAFFELEARGSVPAGQGIPMVLRAADFGLAGAQIDLSEIWVDVSVSTDGMYVGWLERSD